jgi:hypothetical protein
VLNRITRAEGLADNAASQSPKSSTFKDQFLTGDPPHSPSVAGFPERALKRQFHFFELLFCFLRGFEVFLRRRKRLVA